MFALYLNKQLENSGIKVHDFLNLLSQLADDTNLYLKYNVSIINKAWNALQYMNKQMGLKINYNK